MTKLTNSKGKMLYSNPENIRKAMARRKDKVFGKGVLKYNESISIFKREARHELTA